MGDVINFPTHDAKVKKLEDTLTGWIAGLEETYDELDALHDSLHNLEQEASRQETDYDEVIKEYIDEVGIENVPALWLTYSRSCAIKALESGEYEMIWLGTDLEDTDE
jgi:hypothetical protein